MRQFVIQFEDRDVGPVVCMEDDTFGIIGEILSRVSQMDDGDFVTITCIDD